MTSFTTFALQTYSANNTVQVASTANMVSGVPITFSGSAFGNIAPGANYYVGNITAVNNITLTTLPGGATWPVANGTGNMTATFTGAGQEIINTGTTPNDGTGSPLRTAFTDTNVNFDQIFAAGPVGSNIRIVNNTVSTVNTNGNLVLNPNGIGAVVANAHVIPDTANIRNLGSQARRFATVYTQYLDVNQFTNLTISTANLHITGGSNGYFLQTDGTGNLTWSAGSGGTYGNANVAAYLPTYSGNIANLTITGNLTVIGNTVQANIVEQVVTVVGNITGGNLFTANTVSAGGNVVAGNITTIGLVSATGNVFGNYILGNGSQLTGLPATYSNSNVVTLLAAFGSNTISTTGNITAGGFTTTGSSGNITGANYVTANVFALTTAGTGTTSVIRQNQNPPVGSEPFGIEMLTTSDTAGIYSSVSAGPDYVTLNSSNGGNANIVLQGGYGVTVSTTDPAGSNEHDWTFGIDGSLKFPSIGNITNAAIAYVADDEISFGTGSGNISIWPGDGHWIFDTNGDLTLPVGGNLIVAGGGIVSNGASPAPSIDGFYVNAVAVSVSGNITVTGNINGTQLALNANRGNALTAVERITADRLAQPPQNNGVMLQISGQTGVPTRSYIDGIANYAAHIGRRYNGTPTAPSGVLAGNILARFGATPYTSNGWTSLSTTRIDMVATENQTATAQGSSITLAVTPTGSNTIANIATVTGAGLNVLGNILANNLALTSNLGSNVSSVLSINADGLSQPVNSVGVMLHLTGQENQPARVVMDAANSYVSYTNRIYSGTTALPTGVAGNTLMSRYSANPYTSTGWLSNSTTRIEMWTTEAQTTAARGSQIVFATTPTGSNAVANVAIINNTGVSVAGNIYSTGLVSAGGNVRGGNINTVGLITATGNVYGNNISTTGNIVIANGRVDLNSYGTPTFNSIGYGIAGPTSSLNIQAGPDQNITLYTLNSFYSWKFDQAGNLTAPGNVTATGNVYANYFVGDGSQLTGLPSSYTNSNVSTLLSAYGNTISTTGNVFANVISTSGNVRGANINTAGLVTATGNIVTAGNFVGNGAALTNVTISVAGNVVGSQANVSIAAGSYTWTFDNTGNVTLPSGGDLVFSANTSLTSISNGNITIDPNGTGQLVVTAITPATFGNTLSVTGTVTSLGTTNGTAFAVVGNGAASNVALGFFPTGNTPAQMAIRDYSTANSYMYFDATAGSANAGGTFAFRSSNAYTVLATINTYGVSQPTKPGFRVYGSGVTGGLNVTTNGNGVLNGNNWAVDYNQGSYLNSTTGVFAAPAAGLYQVNLVARVANNTAGASQAVVIKNASTTPVNQLMWEVAANCTTNHFGVGTVSKLAVGDTLTLKVTQGNVTFDVNDSWSVAFIG